MESRRWVNQSQPQTLVIAVFLLYLDAAFLALLGGGLRSVVGMLLVAGHVGAGWGIANERRWGWYLGLVIAGLRLLPFVVEALPLPGTVVDVLEPFLLFGGGDIITLMFSVAKLALLLHPQSRDYQRVWFR